MLNVLISSRKKAQFLNVNVTRQLLPYVKHKQPLRKCKPNDVVRKSRSTPW